MFAVRFKTVFTLLTVVCVHIRCAKILGVFNAVSVSHQVVFQPIWKELSLRGHEVTVITPNPLKDPTLTNLTEIDLGFLYNNGSESVRRGLAQGMDHWQMAKLLSIYTVRGTERIFNHSSVLTLIRDNDVKFDVVLAEAMYPSMFAFAWKFKCPLIGIASLNVLNPLNEAVGNVGHPVLYPDVTTSFSENMNFFNKIEAVLFDLWQRYLYHYVIFPELNKVIRKYFGDSFPDVRDVTRNMSMLFLNTNPILHKPRPYGPNVIQMGRMHLKPKQPLPPVSISALMISYILTSFLGS